MSHKSCTAPSDLAKPQVTSISAALVSVSWQDPVSNGGCSITSFHLYLKRVDVAEYIEVDAAQITNKPYLTYYDMDMSIYTTGHDYLVKVEVDNRVGTAVSDSVVFLLANVPDAPGVPTRTSDGKTLTVVMSEPASDGGSQIINYEL